jgi:parallel beta-helix repeat protein
MWGLHHRISIQDSTIDGSGTASTGVDDNIGDSSSGDTSVLRTTIANFMDYGINFYPWTPTGTFPGSRALAVSNSIAHIQNPHTNDGTNESGIWTGGANAVIFDNTITDTGWDGIETFGQANSSHIIGNAITNTQTAIYLEHSTNDSLFAANAISQCKYGIYVEWLYSNVGSQRNTFTGNSIVGAFQGIHIELGDDNNTITGNSVLDSQDTAIVLESSSHNTLSGNDLRTRVSQPTEHYGVREIVDYLNSQPVPADFNTLTGNNAQGSTLGIASLTGAHDTLAGNIWP